MLVPYLLIVFYYRNSETTLQRKETKAQEMLMKGPGSFSLERLLAIFQCITSVSDICVDEDEEVFGGDKEVGLISDALLQLSTLCDANFITKGGSCPLDSTRYRSSIDEDMISKVMRIYISPSLLSCKHKLSIIMCLWNFSTGCQDH